MEALTLEECVSSQLSLTHEEVTPITASCEEGGKNSDVETVKKRRGKVKQRNYVLNDAGALRKKMRQCDTRVRSKKLPLVKRLRTVQT